MNGDDVNHPANSLSAAATGAVPAGPTVTAHWVRDDTYRDRAVRMALVDRPAWARFMAPVWLGLAIALVFSPWGALGILYGGEPLAWRWPTVVLAGLLLGLGAVQTFHAQRRATARQYAFAGDTTQWEFSAAGLAYRCVAPDGSLRHASFSQWGWFGALSVDVTGLRLKRRGTLESYFVPATGFVRPGQDAVRAQQAVAAWAREAGVPVRGLPAWDAAGLLGMGVCASLLVGLAMVHAAMVAALPHLRWGRVSTLFFSGVETFWWAAVPCAAVVVALHLLLARLQHHRAPGRDLPALAPHLVLALGWCALLLAGLQSLRGLVFDDALVRSSFVVPGPVIVAAVFALLTGFVVHRGLAVPWVARRMALHNDVPGPLP